MKNKILVILGPTASGKSALAVTFAKRLARTKWGGFNGAEIISADSRQVYKGLDIGTGKITKKEMRGVPHHLLDVADPKRQFSVVKYQELAREKISEIFSRGHLPIICGGTGFYISALVDNIVLPDVPPNPALRKKLHGETAETLLNMLLKLDPRRAKTIDVKNPRRIIRAIEIATAIGRVPELTTNNAPPYDFLQIGIKVNPEKLKEKISIRLFARLPPARHAKQVMAGGSPKAAGSGGQARIREGMIEEAKKLHARGLSWKRMDELGLEYRYLALFLQKKITEQKMIAKLQTEIWHYAKRQKLWWQRDKRTKWFELEKKMDIEKTIERFIKR